ncbi:hypothetical protein [Marinobacter arenosus]|uniref:hypothetical protein n=1 Tax=Marinobacter arenosus TaxID=2856822 RepID=UPI001C4BAEBA|nr:hypothetical protein [Marinobacter arenosus]MBW0148039.1 hypothetical protein [Marinobacter arenosus]
MTNRVRLRVFSRRFARHERTMNRVFIFLAIATLAGCASSTVPRNDSGFVEVVNLTAFEGCYRNCSNTADGSALACLSDIVWPKVFEPESKPEAVFIKQEDNHRIIVSAISNGMMLRTSTFEAGRDFEFTDGRIELNREYVASGAHEPGNVFIGVGTAKTVLGLDAQGQGRISQSVSFAGTGFLIIPIAGAATDVSKIERSVGLCD